MSRSVLIAAVTVGLITAIPIRATTIPLLEMTFQQGAFEIGPVPPTVEFVYFGADGMGVVSYFGWIAEHGPTDAGKSFWAPNDIIEGVNVALKADAEYGLGNGPGNFVGFSLPLDQPPSSERPCPMPGENCFGIAIYVDGIESHTVTAVERVINYLVLTERAPHEPPFQTGSYTLAASQTIRYWGVRVPEPSTLGSLMVFVGHLWLSYRQRRLS